MSLGSDPKEYEIQHELHLNKAANLFPKLKYILESKGTSCKSGSAYWGKYFDDGKIRIEYKHEDASIDVMLALPDIPYGERFVYRATLIAKRFCGIAVGEQVSVHQFHKGKWLDYVDQLYTDLTLYKEPKPQFQSRWTDIDDKKLFEEK